MIPQEGRRARPLPKRADPPQIDAHRHDRGPGTGGRDQVIVTTVGEGPQEAGQSVEEGVPMEGAVERRPIGRQQGRPVGQPQRRLGPGPARGRVGHLVLVEVDGGRGLPDHPAGDTQQAGQVQHRRGQQQVGRAVVADGPLQVLRQGDEPTLQPPLPELPLVDDRMDLVTAVRLQALGPLAVASGEVRFEQVDAHSAGIAHGVTFDPGKQPREPATMGRASHRRTRLERPTGGLPTRGGST